MSDNAAPETIQVLRVKGWNEHFESAKSRTYKHKSQTYMPNKHGLGYRRIMAEKNGPSIFGAWVSMIQVLSRYHPRDGYLTDTTVSDGRPLTQLDISLMTHVPERVVEEMLTVCSSQVVAWLEIVEVQAPQGHNKDTTVTCQSPYPSPSPSPLPSPLPESKRGASAFTLPECVSAEEEGMQGGKKPVTTSYGEFRGVKLTDEDHAKLTAKQGADRLAKGIEILDDYMRAKGKRYKDHYAVLKETSWVWEKVDKAEGVSPDRKQKSWLPQGTGGL